jgi:beta-lactamase class A
MYRLKLLTFISLLLTTLLTAILTTTIGLAAEDFPLLRESHDPALQSQLRQLIKERGLQDAVDQERLAVTLVDLCNQGKPNVASINGDVMEYAASLPKIAILLSAFVQIEQGILELNDKLEADLTAMIRHSNNPAATRVLDLVGREELLNILQSPKFKLYDERYDGGLWVGKAYSVKGAYHRDPLNSISHGATTMQVARFYYLLDSNRLVSPELTARMKQILSEPAINHKFVKGLNARTGLTIYRKSGTWRDFHADSALVESGECKYIIVALAQDPNGGQWMEDLASPLHDLVVARERK